MFAMFPSSQKQRSTRLDVEMGKYQFIPKGKIPENLDGFVTSNVVECVCGFISSEQGFAFFHFFRMNDPKYLTDLIKRDFAEATHIKMVLIGGNPTNLFLPWKEKKRELKFMDWNKGTQSIEVKMDFEALISLRRSLKEDADHFTKCVVPKEKSQNLHQIISECIITKEKTA